MASLTDFNGRLYVFHFPNGKKYAGASGCCVTRLEWHRCAALRGGDLPVYRAIRKHGWDNIRVDVLPVQYSSPAAMMRAERELIAKLDCTVAGGGGYNLTLGGEGTYGYRKTEAQRLRSRDAQDHLYREHMPQVEQMRAAGDTIKTISKAIGVSRMAIGRWLRRAGHPTQQEEYAANRAGNFDAAMDFLSAGMSQREVAAKLGVAECTVFRWVKSSGRLNRDEFREANIGRVIRLRQAGMTQAQCAREIGVSDGTIGRWESVFIPRRRSRQMAISMLSFHSLSIGARP